MSSIIKADAFPRVLEVIDRIEYELYSSRPPIRGSMLTSSKLTDLLVAAGTARNEHLIDALAVTELICPE